MTNAARAELEQTLEWAPAQGSVIIGPAQQGAEQLLAAAGLSAENMERVVGQIGGDAGAAEPQQLEQPAETEGPPEQAS